MQAISSELETKARAVKAAAPALARASTDLKNAALLAIARNIEERVADVLTANAADCADSRAAGLSDAMLDRLTLTEGRLRSLAEDVRKVAALPDPVGEMFDVRMLPNGLQVGRRRVPLGVIAVIYESRPNVTVDVASLALKSGNAALLRGGREAIRSNIALAAVVREAIAEVGLPEQTVELVESTDRAIVGELLGMRETIDIVVPRGGADFIRYVMDNATMPVIAHGDAVSHTYVDAAADVMKAVEIVVNAKCRRWGICNALDTLLVHEAIATPFLQALAPRWAEYGIEARCDERAGAVLAHTPLAGRVRPVLPEDYGFEFLAPVAAVRVVDSLEEAMAHIELHSSRHSEAIVTENYTAAQRFLEEVDSACVYVNASTQFTDGAQFGLGAEIGISTQKMHARGPMGLRELTSYKWIILGSGQIRP
ncbi:MAG TPA: glutamate-5-semialdehyde dehydrogenase [Dehalococcoidia bacterium]|nr:glutamate-5-semialdehyde dehydrogenase [Dehalococcoidia bacterium]